VQLAELARAHEDALLALMLDDFALDSQRSRDWSAALVQYAVARRPANKELLEQWVEHWKPLALSGYGSGGRSVRASALSAGTRYCFGKSAGHARQLLGSLWSRCNSSLNGFLVQGSCSRFSLGSLFHPSLSSSEKTARCSAHLRSKFRPTCRYAVHKR
jgi:hypothetical protein